MFSTKKSVILSNVGSTYDRYCASYGDPFTIEEMFDRVKSIDGVSGVELVGRMHINSDNVNDIKALLQRTGLEVVSIIPDHFSEKKWKMGAFSNKDSGIRREAVEVTKNMIDLAVELNCPLITLWPGQDGYDYPFQGDFIKERTWFEEGVAEVCEYNKDMKIAIEYKSKEPRIRSYPSNVYSTLLMIQEIGMDNCGITLDFGHALMAYENVAESVAVLKKYGDKLFHLHLNDNFSFWDDDMIAGSVNTIAYLEFYYWLKKTGYQHWISTDQYPYREDGRDAVNETIRWMETFEKIVNKIDDNQIEQILSRGNAVESVAYVRELMFG